ncbi:VWA domain-containing protein [Robertkochia sediminum]|uniref:VWA domain-containing protein n=1 Tax=Robertkochia sediminum TaxID=2785326 RepID=UPI00193255BD|nr:VWA domain-containing protein [Robertkochia sediminum]MBL7473526.1 VWA domain-containing protein [Robertkochia sediminum]
MRLPILYPAFLLFSLLFLSCGNADDGPNTQGIDPCLDLGKSELRVTIQEEYTTLPGKVSVFFKVNDVSGDPVPGLTASSFNIYEKGRNDNCFNPISATESNARISPNEQIFRQHTLLVLDLSNSVLSQSLQELKSASVSFIRNVMPVNPNPAYQMGIFWFDGEDVLHELQGFTEDRDVLTAAIESITTNISQDPSTDLYGAVIKSTAIANDLVMAADNEEIISAASVVLFTDGTDQAGRYTRNQALGTVESADENISFFSIGLGSEIDEAVLLNIGKTSSVFANNKEELEATFNEISEAVGGQARSFYLFEYCSPKRDGSGINQLVIQAVDGSRSGAVQTKFDATGFTSGCR